MLSKEEFKNIFDLHFDAIRSYVYYRCGDMELASDVAQDVFMKLWEKRHVLNGYPVKPLLYKMASDCYIDNYRKQLCRMNYEQSIVPEQDYVLTPDEELSFSELTATYARALEQMPEKQRTTFLMSREEGMKYTEIADNLNVSVKAVEKQVSAALRFLKMKLL